MAGGEEQWREKCMIESEKSIGGMWTNARSLDFILNKMKHHWRIFKQRSNMIRQVFKGLCRLPHGAQIG